MQLLTHVLGGAVAKSPKREFGRAELNIHKDEGLFSGIGEAGKASVWMSHGDRIENMPDCSRAIAHTRKFSARPPWPMRSANSTASSSIPRSCILRREWRFCETSYTASADANLHGPWRLLSTIPWRDTESRREQAGGLRPFRRRRFLGCRGAGAQGHRQTADLHLRNNGVLRKDEAEKVQHSFKDMGLNLKYVDASAGISCQAERGRGSGEKTARSSAILSSKCSSGRPRPSAEPNSLSRVRSIPT